MNPETDVSSGRVRKRDDDYYSDHSVESSRRRSQFVANPRSNCNHNCKEPHANVDGAKLRDILSITIRPSRNFKEPIVEIYGAVWVDDGTTIGLSYSLFMRDKSDPLRVEVDPSNPGQNISLPLRNPKKLSFFDDTIPKFSLIFVLMFNDDTIFNETRYSQYVLDSGDIFSHEDVAAGRVGCGIYCLPRYIPTGWADGCVEFINLPKPIENEGMVRSDKVASVDAKMVIAENGKVACLGFKTAIGGLLYGKITARLCLLPEEDHMVLFETNENAAAYVSPNGRIPLLRNLVAVGCGSSLVIDVQLHDAFDYSPVLHGTIHFHIGDTSPNTMLRGKYSHLIQPKIIWTTRLRRMQDRKNLDLEFEEEMKG